MQAGGLLWHLGAEIDDEPIRVTYLSHPLSPGHISWFAVACRTGCERAAIGGIDIVNVEPERNPRVSALDHVFTTDSEGYFPNGQSHVHIVAAFVSESVGPLGIERSPVEPH